MLKRSFTLALALLLVMAAALPASATHKSRWSAHLSTGAELHEVVDSDAEGRFRIIERRNGFSFGLAINGLSGPAGAAHIHGPAGPDANAGILLTLCGGPAPAAVAECTTLDDGRVRVRGFISHELLASWGLSADDLASYMSAGQAYVNVHTVANPAGEVRGQIGG